jgi:nucleotide-binding universal stress UspA family protein
MKKILVPTDFSELSRASLSYAAMLALKMDVELILLHVIDISNSEMLMKRARLEEEVVQLAREDAAYLMDDIRAEVGEKLRIRYEYRMGHPLHRVVDNFVQQNNVGLIVMGLHGETGLRKVLMGRVTTSVINNSSVPVIAVPADAVFQLDKIFYATDMSNLSSELSFLIKFARLFNASVHVIHVLTRGESHPDKNQIKEQIKRLDYPNIYFHVLRGDEIARLLNTFVRRAKAHMLAMFTHRQDFFQQLFATSITQDVAAQNHLPVLTVNMERVKEFPSA